MSESNRRAKYYKLTRGGRAQLKREVAEWRDMVRAIGKVLDPSPTPAVRAGWLNHRRRWGGA